MKKVQLANQLGNIETKKVGYSYLHFFLGPIYSFFRIKIVLGLFELLFIYYLLPIPGMDFLASSFSNLSIFPIDASIIIYNIMMYFRTDYHFIFGIIFLLIFDFIISMYIESSILKKYMKKKHLLPVEEKDARILIKYRVSNIKVPLSESFDLRKTQDYKKAEESWNQNNETKIKKVGPSYASRSELLNSTDKRIRIQLDQLQNSYKLGLISKEEYEEKYKKIIGE